MKMYILIILSLSLFVGFEIFESRKQKDKLNRLKSTGFYKQLLEKHKWRLLMLLLITLIEFVLMFILTCKLMIELEVLDYYSFFGVMVVYIKALDLYARSVISNNLVKHGELYL